MISDRVSAPREMPTRNAAAWMSRSAWAILAGGLLLRGALLLALAHRPLVSDSLSYHLMGRSIAETGRVDTYLPPGLPYYLALAYRIFGDSQVVARVAMLVLYGLLAVVLYRLVRSLGSERAATLALALVSVYPTCVLQSIEPQTHLPAALAMTAAAYALVRIIQGAPRALLLACVLGLTLGAFVLIRPSSALVLLAVVATLAVRYRKPARVILTVGLTSCCVVALWIGKAHALTGRIVPVNDANAENFYIGNNPYTPLYKTWWYGSHTPGSAGEPTGNKEASLAIKSHPVAARSALYRQEAVRHITSRPDLFVLRTFNRICCYLGFETWAGSYLRGEYGFSWVVSVCALLAEAAFSAFILAVAGVALLLKRDLIRREERWTLVLLMTTYAVPYFLSFSHPTYRFPVMPILIALAAITLDALSRRPLRVRVKPSRSAVLLGAVFLALQLEWLVMNVRNG